MHASLGSSAFANSRAPQLLPFGQSFACCSAGLPDSSLDSALRCPFASLTFSSLRLLLGHEVNEHVI